MYHFSAALTLSYHWPLHSKAIQFFQVPPSCCSSANFTCPDLSLNPTAVLPQVEPYLAATQLILTFSDGVWLLLCPCGRHSACSCSLPCSGCCFPVGWGTARLLPGKVLVSSENISSSPYPGWLPPRRGNGMSLVTIDRRESSGTKFETYANFGCFVESGPEEESLKSRNQELLHHNLLPCNYLLSCVCLLFPTHYFDNSIVNQIHPVAILLLHFDIGGSIFY